MPVFSDDTTAKELYLSALNQLTNYDDPNADPKTIFQPFASLVRINWDKPNAPDFDTYLQSQFLDKLPNWGTFAMPLDTSLYDAFGDFCRR